MALVQGFSADIPSLRSITGSRAVEKATIQELCPAKELRIFRIDEYLEKETMRLA